MASIDLSPPAPPPQPSRTPSFRGPQEMITVAVRSPSTNALEQFTIHKSFVDHYSPYFTTLHPVLDRDGRPRIPEFETEPNVFTGLVHWIYTQTVKDIESPSLPKLSIEFLVGLWILAEQCAIPKLQNQVMHLLQLGETSYCTDDGQLLNFVYYNSMKNSPIRRALVDMFIQDMGSLMPREVVDYSSVPHDMLIDIIEVFRAQKLVRKFTKTQYADLMVGEDIEKERMKRREGLDED
ncbi:hypothetical protein BJ878DRAFT_541309 [Calycina marina]|uniref:BTB domain-containing protein n=1 Tax=Calycina marina TaxID=1763456 RepID=A0A9P7Z5S8_9HELO|nr:hypothetical protein BJ878DRAFT_541309 [Calycina marina]